MGAMTMKGYSTFPKAPILQEPHHCLMSYLTVVMQSVYSTAPADRVILDQRKDNLKIFS